MGAILQWRTGCIQRWGRAMNVGGARLGRCGQRGRWRNCALGAGDGQAGMPDLLAGLSRTGIPACLGLGSPAEVAFWQVQAGAAHPALPGGVRSPPRTLGGLPAAPSGVLTTKGAELREIFCSGGGRSSYWGANGSEVSTAVWVVRMEALYVESGTVG
jgi:hypothetical protein